MCLLNSNATIEKGQMIPCDRILSLNHGSLFVICIWASHTGSRRTLPVNANGINRDENAYPTGYDSISRVRNHALRLLLYMQKLRDANVSVYKKIHMGNVALAGDISSPCSRRGHGISSSTKWQASSHEKSRDGGTN